MAPQLIANGESYRTRIPSGEARRVSQGKGTQGGERELKQTRRIKILKKKFMRMCEGRGIGEKY